MKRLLNLLVISILCFGTATAQSSSDHLKFKGIPITGCMTDFCKALSQKGFTKIDCVNNITFF